MNSSIEFFDPIRLSDMTALDVVLTRCMPTQADMPDLRIALERLIISASGVERDPQKLALSVPSRPPEDLTGAQLPQAHRSSA